MLKLSVLKRSQQVAVTPSAPQATQPRRSKREIIYSQLLNTTRRLRHPFVMVLAWPSAATVYHRRRLLEATIIGLLLTELLCVAILLPTWFAPPPPLMVSLGADQISVVQSASPTSFPAIVITPTIPVYQPTTTPSPIPGSNTISTPATGVYLPLWQLRRVVNAINPHIILMPDWYCMGIVCQGCGAEYPAA